MPSIRFRLDPAPLDRVAETVRERYGVAATVVSAEEVRVGGIGGFFEKTFAPLGLRKIQEQVLANLKRELD